jgi:DNA (cytosine-5)-methyltransferase 1
MPKIIDLFAGAGGLSLGAARAGFDIASAVELDPFAVETHTKNFPQSIHIAEDVTRLTGNRLLLLSGLRVGELDGLIGGPPCQGFSLMGRRQVDDERNDLFGHFFRLVTETKPSFFLAENVPGILGEKFRTIRNKAFRKLTNEYVILQPIEVKANNYGAPTTRTRIFFFGYNPKKFRYDFTVDDFVPPSDVELTFVGKALTALPTRIDCRWQSEEQGWREIGKIGKGNFFDRIANAVPKRVGDPSSLERYFEQALVSGCLGTRHTDEVKRRFQSLKPGQVDEASKAIRLDPNGLCPTLRAGTAKDRGSYQAVRPIHHKSPRVITPREAARLQGFPDWFVFHSTKWHSFRQIGNSVSPLVAEQLLSMIAQSL